MTQMATGVVRRRHVRRQSPAPAPRGARARARLTAERLAWVHPTKAELEFASTYELLVVIILSAQSTDRRANEVGGRLVARYPDPAALAAANLEDLDDLIRPIGFFQAKSRILVAAGRTVVERYGGTVPHTMADLLTIPGIGLKSANAILGLGFGLPAIVTDRHLIRVAHRLRLVSEHEPALVERQLARLLAHRDWTHFSLRMTLHGRYVCLARRPRCERCVLNDFCPSSATRAWPAEARLALSLSLANPSPVASGVHSAVQSHRTTALR